MSDLNFSKLLLLTVMETFSPLRTPEEKRRFQELMATPEHRRTREFRQTWIDQLTTIGLLEAKRSTLVRQIRARFGSPSDELVWKIRRLKSLEELDAHLDSVLTARSLEDMGLLGSIDSTTTNTNLMVKTDERTMSDLEHYRKLLMLDLVETFTPVMTPEEERQFKDATLKAEYRDKGVFRDTWAEEVMINGLLEGKRSTLLRQINARFGSPPEGVARRILRLQSLDELDAHLNNLLTARSLENMELLGPTDLTSGALDEWNTPEDDEAFRDL